MADEIKTEEKPDIIEPSKAPVVNDDIKALIAELREQYKVRNEGKKTVETPEVEDEVDWETLTNKERAKLIEAQTLKKVAKALEPMVNQVIALTRKSDQSGLAKKYTDAEGLMVEIEKLSLKYPGIEPDDLYALAKAKQPVKPKMETPPKTMAQRTSIFGTAKAEIPVTDDINATSSFERAWEGLGFGDSL